MFKTLFLIALFFLFFASKTVAQAKYPAPVEHDFMVKDFVFESGEKTINHDVFLAVLIRFKKYRKLLNYCLRPILHRYNQL
jgi:hypothetical protein